MSRTKNNKIRCDRCGVLSSNDSGEYHRPGDSGAKYINSHGRNCPHDYCEECEDTFGRPWSRCPKCGISPLDSCGDEERESVLSKFADISGDAKED